MVDTVSQQIAQKKSFLQRVRDEYKRYRGNRKLDKEFKRDLKELDAERQGVPREYRHINLNEFKWTSPSFMMDSFRKIVSAAKNPDARQMIVDELTALTSGRAGKIEERQLYNRLVYRIFREVTGEPYCVPMFESQKTKEDIKNENFLNLISRGVAVYRKAAPEVREEFNRGVLPNVKKGKVVVPVISQQTR